MHYLSVLEALPHNNSHITVLTSFNFASVKVLTRSNTHVCTSLYSHSPVKGRNLKVILNEMC